MIPQAHIVAMERVDQIEIPPHEPIAAIHGGKAALGNAGP